MSDYFYTRNGRPVPEDEALDAQGIIRDGYGARTRLAMRDHASLDSGAMRLTDAELAELPAWQREFMLEQRGISVVDGQGDTAGLHRPGFRLAAADAADTEEDEETRGTERQTSDAALRSAYSDYEKYITDAWKTPVGITGAGEHGPLDNREGQPCTRNGWPGTWRCGERLCPHCEGKSDCPLCHGTGLVSAAHEKSAEEAEQNTETYHEGLGRNRRRVDQAMTDHQQRMAQLYDAHDAELREAWRRG